MTDRTFAAVPAQTIKSMSGLDLLTAIRDGRLPAPPISQTLDFTLATVEPGFVVFIGRPGLAHYNPIGTVHGGYAGTLLDSCMGCAVHSMLPAGTGYTTLEYKVHLVRPILAETGEVRAEGRIVHSGRRAATAEGRILDGQGRMLAHGTTTCLVFAL